MIPRQAPLSTASFATPPRRGVILLSVAWSVLILALLLAGLVCREEMAFTRTRISQTDLNLRQAAGSAQAMFLAGLAADGARSETSYDALSDAWGWPGLKKQFAEQLGQDYPGIQIDVQVRDEAGKISPLKAPPEVLTQLLKNLGWPETQLQGLSESILKACQDAAQTPAATGGASQPAGGPGSLKPPLPDLRLLWAVPALSEEILCGEDTNFNSSLEANENDGGQSFPPDDRDGVLRPGLLDFLSVWSDGKVNPNMAPLEILLTVPGISKKIAAEIITKREGADGIAGTLDDFIFKTNEDLKKLSSISKFDELEYQKMKPLLRMSTNLFELRICAASKRTGQMLRRQIIVRRKKGKSVILSELEDGGC